MGWKPSDTILDQHQLIVQVRGPCQFQYDYTKPWGWRGSIKVLKQIEKGTESRDIISSTSAGIFNLASVVEMVRCSPFFPLARVTELQLSLGQKMCPVKVSSLQAKGNHVAQSPSLKCKILLGRTWGKSLLFLMKRDRLQRPSSCASHGIWGWDSSPMVTTTYSVYNCLQSSCTQNHFLDPP